jgi:DNA polymerase III, epsilon subunit and related 3''-5'' exonucleases
MASLVLDLELSGIEPGWHEIIQIGAALYNDEWGLISTYISNVYPENRKSFSLSSQRVHQLTMEELEDAPMLYEVLDEFERWIAASLKNNLLRRVKICGQSVMYDVVFLKTAYRQEKKEWPFSNMLLDLHNIAYYLFEVLAKNGKKTPNSLILNAIAGFFGLAREGMNIMLSKMHLLPENALKDA